MAEQIITAIKPMLVEELKKAIKEHETDFDQVEKGIDKVIDDIKEKIKTLAGPAVKGIKLIPFGDPKKNLEELATNIKNQIESIKLSDELSNIDVPETIKSRVAALPEKVKTKLKDSIDEIITGEEKHVDSTITEVSPSYTSTEAGESKTESASASSTSTEVNESKTESASASSSSTDSDIKETFSSLATDQKDEARKEIIKKLIEDKIFNNPEHIFEFIKIIPKVASPPTTEPEQPQEAGIDNTQVESNTSAKIESSTEGPVTATAQDNSNTQAENQIVGIEEAKTEEAKTEEAKTDITNIQSDLNTLPTPPTQANGTDSNMPPIPPSAAKETGTEEAKTKGGAPKKQRRKTKKNIRRGKLNKSTRFGRAF